MKLLISVIIPFYNSEATLARTIESVLDQEFENKEIILVNDGSIDASQAIAESHLENQFVKIINQRNQGVCTARNNGAKIANGQFLVFLDSDDTLEKGFLIEFLKLKDSFNNYDLIQFGIRIIKGDQVKEIYPKKGEYFPRIPGTFLIRKLFFNSLGGYDERLKFSENTEFFHRADLKDIRIINLDTISLNYHDSENGGSKNLQNMIDSNLIILNKHKDTLSSHTQRLYHQVIGVNQLRFRRFSEARFHLWKAYWLNPRKFKTFARFSISLWPWLARKIYTEKVKIQ